MLRDLFLQPLTFVLPSPALRLTFVLPLFCLRAGEVLENFGAYRPNLLCEEPSNNFRPFVLTPEIIAQKHSIGVEIYNDGNAASEKEVPLLKDQSGNEALSVGTYGLGDAEQRLLYNTAKARVGRLEKICCDQWEAWSLDDLIETLGFAVHTRSHDDLMVFNAAVGTGVGLRLRQNLDQHRWGRQPAIASETRS